MQLYVKVGSIYEDDYTSGYSHFIEHLVFKATKKYSFNQISSLITSLGGIVNAYTEYDSTCYYILIPSEYTQVGLDVLLEMGFSASFSEKDIKIEKSIILEEIKQYANDPEAAFVDWIQTSYFKHNPLKRPVLGTKKSINSATLHSLSSFYQKYYAPSNCFFVLSGDLDSDKCIYYIEKFFENSKIVFRDNPPKHSFDDMIECNGFLTITKKVKSEIDYLALVVPELKDTYENSLLLLTLTLGFASGKKSRLFKRLVEKDKTCSEIKMYSISGLFNGITIIQVLPNSSSFVQDILYAIYDEWLTLSQNGLSDYEFNFVIEELYYSWLYVFEYIESIANSLADEELANTYMSFYTYPEKLKCMTLDKVNKAGKIYLTPSYLAIYHSGPQKLHQTIIKNIKDLFSQTENHTNFIVPNSLILNNQVKYNSISKYFTIENSFYNDVIFFKQTKNTKVESNEKSKKKHNEFRQVILDNGMNLLMKRVKDKPVIGIALSIRISQLNDPPDMLGLNNLTSLLLLYGTQKKSYDDLLTESIHKGFNIKISNSLETTTLKCKCLPFFLKDILELIYEVLTIPSFPSKYLKLIKNSIILNLKQEKDFPFNRAYDNWIKLILGKNTNFHHSTGNISSIKHLPLSKVTNWYQTYYGLENFNLCLTGDFDFTFIEDLCNTIFKPVPHKTSKPHEYQIIEPSSIQRKVRKYGRTQAQILIGGYAPPTSYIIHNLSFNLLSQIIGGDVASRFFNILREKYGYAYQTGCFYTSTTNLGYWMAYATCDSKNCFFCEKEILSIMNDIITNSVTEDELTTAKKYLLGMKKIEEESLVLQASTLSMLYALGFDYNYYMEKEKRLMSITKDDMSDITSLYLNPKNYYIYIEK